MGLRQFLGFNNLPLLWLSLAFLLGVVLGSLFALSFAAWLFLGLLLAFPAVFFRKRLANKEFLGLSLVFLLLVVAALAFGAARYRASLPTVTQQDIAYYNDSDQEIVLTGLIVEPPVAYDAYVELRVEVRELWLPGGEHPLEVGGRLLVRVSHGQDWRYGDRVRLSGRLFTPGESETFSYQDYLARQGIGSLMPFANTSLIVSGRGNLVLSAIYSLRRSALDLVYRLYPDPAASLLAGILLGDESGLSSELKEAFNDTGVRHIIAISGFNITIIAGLLVSAFRRWLGARRGAWLAIGGIAFYTLLVGADAAVVRAAIMGGLTLFARQVGRRQMALNTLAFTAAVMALFNPLLLWDVSFQLSFAATLGLVLYAQLLNAWLDAWLESRFSSHWQARLSTPLTEYLLFTIAAQITTLPLLLYYFQRFSLTFLPANLLVLPVQPALMVLGGLSLMLGLVAFPFGQLLALAAWPLAAYTIRVVEIFAGVAWAAIPVAQFTFPWLFLYYLILGLITFRPSLLQDRVRQYTPGYRLAGLGLVVLWIWLVALNAPDNKLHLTVLDVDGPATLFVRTPLGRNILVNGGPSAVRLSEELGNTLPFGEDLDWLLVAGVQNEQLAALVPTIERWAASQIGWAGASSGSYQAGQLQSEATELGYEMVDLAEGQVFDLGGGAALEVLATSPRGAVLLLTMGEFKALLPIGLDFDLLEDLAYGRQIGPVDALLLTDSGFAPLNPPEWIQNLDSKILLLSVEAGNLQGLPSPETLELLSSRTLLRTDVNGWIRLSTDGENLWVESAR